jgi:hypothetical protein
MSRKILLALLLILASMAGCVHSTVTVRYQPDPHTSVDVTLYR